MVELQVNGRRVEVSLPGEAPLLWALRDGLRFTGTKYGCGIGLCGVCTVLLDGEPVRSCLTPLASVSGRSILTIEGLSPDRSHPVQRAWIAEQVPQCGYCQSGQILTAVALLARHPRPTDAQIDAALSAVLCRCGTYPRIRRAVRRAAGLMAGEAAS